MPLDVCCFQRKLLATKASRSSPVQLDAILVNGVSSTPRSDQDRNLNGRHMSLGSIHSLTGESRSGCVGCDSSRFAISANCVPSVECDAESATVLFVGGSSVVLSRSVTTSRTSCSSMFCNSSSGSSSPFHNSNALGRGAEIVIRHRGQSAVLPDWFDSICRRAPQMQRMKSSPMSPNILFYIAGSLKRPIIQRIKRQLKYDGIRDV